MTILQHLTALLGTAQTRLAGGANSIQAAPWARAIRNVRQARHHRSSTSVARQMLDRYPHCYLINLGYAGFPGINLAEYRALSTDGGMPLVRVSARDLATFEPCPFAPVTFAAHGVILLAGNRKPPSSHALVVIKAIEETGWHILTIDDACRILEGCDVSKSASVCLTTRGTWITMVENVANRLGIAESLFPICEQVVATRTAVMVVYTPGLPKPMKLWRMSLKGIMPPLPPVP